MSTIDLKSLGVYTHKEVADSSYARIMLLGAPKIGKTTCLTTTSPKPLVINCDTGSALKGPQNQGGEFLAVNALTYGGWKKAQATAAKLVTAGLAETIIVDTITMLADTLLDALKAEEFSGFDLWNEFDAEFRGGLKSLCDLKAHVFLVAHLTPQYSDKEDDSAGIVPLIPGQGKVKIAGMVDDCILMIKEGKKRSFVLGHQKSWNYEGRNMVRDEVIEADVEIMFEKLGIGGKK